MLQTKALEDMRAMPIGKSGRIVIEIDPEKKRELHTALARDGVSLKQWFLGCVDEYLSDRLQLSLGLTLPAGEGSGRGLR
jgi:hypothetical protein